MTDVDGAMLLLTVAGIVVGAAGLFVSIRARTATRRQPLAEREVGAAERLGEVAKATADSLIHAGFRKEEEALESELLAWKREASALEPWLGSDLNGRVASATYLLESLQRLRIFESVAWTEACHWAFFNVRIAAERRAKLAKPGSHFFPNRDELRDLVSRGQSLGTGLDEVSEWIHDNGVRLIEAGAQENRRRGAVLGAAMALSCGLLIWSIARLIIELA